MYELTKSQNKNMIFLDVKTDYGFDCFYFEHSSEFNSFLKSYLAHLDVKEINYTWSDKSVFVFD